MRRLLPSPAETVIFAAAAILCAALVRLGSAPELRLAGLSMPMFITASLMGFRRYRRMSRDPS